MEVPVLVIQVPRVLQRQVALEDVVQIVMDIVLVPLSILRKLISVVNLVELVVGEIVLVVANQAALMDAMENVKLDVRVVLAVALVVALAIVIQVVQVGVIQNVLAAQAVVEINVFIFALNLAQVLLIQLNKKRKNNLNDNFKRFTNTK